jgi:hypothetical protein
MARVSVAELALPNPDQMVMPGMKPVAIRERLEWMATLPLEPKREQRPLDVGFWDPMRAQIELF